MPTTALDCAGRAPASTALSLHSATRFQLTCLLNVSQSGVALSLPAALQNTPRLAHAHDGFGLRRQSASVDGAFTSFRNPLPADWSPQRKPKRRGATASRRTPKHPRLAHAHDGFGLRRQSASVDGAFTSFRNPLQLTGLLNVSQSGVALPASRRTPKHPRLAHAHDGFGLRRQSVSVDGAFTSFRNPLPADWSPQRKPKRRGATASRRTPKRPRLAHARDGFGLRRQSVSVDGAFTSFRNPLPADWSPQRKPKRRGAIASRRTPKHPRLAHVHGCFGLRRQSASVDGAFTSFRNPLPADCAPQRKPKRRGAIASRRTPKHPRLAHVPRLLWTAPAERQRRRRFHFLPQPASS
jgi:hypothetical protein